MCTGLTYECCQLLTNKLLLYINNHSFFFILFFENISRLRCLNISWTELSSESIQYICETMPRSIEQLNISGQRYNLTDDCNKSSFSFSSKTNLNF
jgi:hypothetical protein